MAPPYPNGSGCDAQSDHNVQPAPPTARSQSPFAQHLDKVEQIKYEDIEVREEIGSGHFKTVQRGVLRSRDVVVLRFAKKSAQDALPREVGILLQAACAPESSRYVPEVYGICEYEQALIVAQELAPCGTLKSVIAGRGRTAARGDHSIARVSLSTRTKLSCSAQIAAAMAFLQSRRIVHGDMSCRNVLVCSLDDMAGAITVKVTDFGLAFFFDEDQMFGERRQHKAVRWCAPEVVKFKRYSYASDVWSLGATIWELYEDGLHPWSCIAHKLDVKAHLKGLAVAYQDGGGSQSAEESPAEAAEGGPDIATAFRQPIGCPEKLHELLLSCLVPALRERPTLDAVTAAVRALLPEARAAEATKAAAAVVAVAPAAEQSLEG
eukprot:TRINITY_DN51968_c0_g1_i2.p1 TRINITY_DN51968_c0_g1~~TRINITY_DN51968_c0_g1_i2.p1  ORF type:complete len:388 (+),score=86.80 TRINITY_DN51968_c0_g1_i2:29-1165(+)